MEGLTEGRIVHYVMEDGPSKGEVRPAIVVRVWRDRGQAQANGCCQLQVFTDGGNDGPQFAGGIIWRTSRLYDEAGAPGTWHWPTR